MKLPREVIDIIYNKADTKTQDNIKKTSKYFYTTREYNKPFLLEVYDFNEESREESYNGSEESESESDNDNDSEEEQLGNCSQCCNCIDYRIGVIKFTSLYEMIKFVSEKIDRHYEVEYNTSRVEYRMYEYRKEDWRFITTINDYFGR
jgi:hypothetical protein